MHTPDIKLTCWLCLCSPQYPVLPAFVSGTARALPRNYHIPLPGYVAVELGMSLPAPADLSNDADRVSCENWSVILG